MHTLDTLVATVILVLRALVVEHIADIELAGVMFVLRSLDTVTVSLIEPNRTTPVFRLAELETIH